MTAAVAVEKAVEVRVRTEGGGEAQDVPCEFASGFFFQQDLSGVRGWIGDEVDAAGGLAVIQEDGSEVGFVSEEAVFGAVIQAAYEATDAALEVALELKKIEDMGTGRARSQTRVVVRPPLPCPSKLCIPPRLRPQLHRRRGVRLRLA